MIRIAAILRRDALLSLSYPFNFAMQWISVVISVTGFYYVSQLVHPSAVLGVDGRPSAYFPYVVTNMAFLGILNAALQGFSRSIRSDQFMGTLESIIASGTSISTLAIGSTLWTLLLGFIQAVLYIAVGAAVFGMDLSHVNVGASLLFIVLGLLCMGALGILSAAVVVVTKQAPPSSLLIGGAASMLAGVLFPVTLLPLPLRAVSWLLPLTHGLAGVRAAFQGASLASVAPDALWLAIATALTFPIALAAFHRAVRTAGRDGTLAHY